MKKIHFSKNQKPLVVAEISANHCGSKKSFLNHIEEAHKCGADLVKIQTYEPQDITLKSKNNYFKIKKGIWKNKYLWDLYKKAQTPYDWHYDAFKLAKKNGINLFSTPFSVRAVNFLEKFNVPLYKISSLEMNDFNLISNIARTKKYIILSTGAGNIGDVKKVLKFINKYHNKVIILHCVSSYPTNIDQANIARILDLQKSFKNNLIGLSDHTSSIYSSLSSIPLGCVIIEKHFKINNKIRSEDSSFSLNQKDFKKLVEYRDLIYKSLYLKSIKKNSSLKFLKRSLFSKKEILPKEKLTKKNIVSLRPKIGIDASQYFKIIGKKVKKRIKKNTPIFYKDIF